MSTAGRPMADSTPVPGEPSGMGGGRIYRCTTLPSTNAWAMDHLETLTHGDVITAEYQTDGRGRRNRSWESGSGDGLACSLVIDNPQKAELITLAGLAAALGTAGYLLLAGLDPSLKWPNDVLVDDRKICGILCESRSAAGRTVIGVGMNVNQSREELRRLGLDCAATSLYAETGVKRNPQAVLGELLPFLSRELSRLAENEGGALADRWREHDWLHDAAVEVTDTSVSVRGVYAGMDRRGRLLLQRSDGSVACYWTGDVRKIRKKGIKE